MLLLSIVNKISYWVITNSDSLWLSNIQALELLDITIPAYETAYRFSFDNLVVPFKLFFSRNPS